MVRRTRDIQKKIWLTPQEERTIAKKMEMIGTENFGAYARKMLIDGYIIVVDYPEQKKLAAEINKIGVNINQIARRLNEEAKAGRLHGTEAAQFLKLSTALTNRMEHVVGKVGDLIKASRARCKLVEVARENQS
mgnify:CR=1 FL=1